MIIAVENISKRRKDASIELITFHKTFEQYLAFSKIKPTSDANKHITASIKHSIETDRLLPRCSGNFFYHTQATPRCFSAVFCSDKSLKDLNRLRCDCQNDFKEQASRRPRSE